MKDRETEVQEEKEVQVNDVMLLWILEKGGFDLVLVTDWPIEFWELFDRTQNCKWTLFFDPGCDRMKTVLDFIDNVAYERGITDGKKIIINSVKKIFQ